MDITALLPSSDNDKLLNISYEERWECLKGIIVPLYMGKYGPDGKSTTIAQVAAFMKSQYSFYAAETQYRTWFRKWGVRKRILQTEKNDVVGVLGKRTHPRTSTSDVTLGGNKEVDKKQLKRHLKGQVRHLKQEAQAWSPGALSSWNLPYVAYNKSLGYSTDQPSPFATAGATPSYLNVHSPEDTTPGRQASAPGPSPTMQLVRQKVALDRASLFLQGRTKELLASCEREDRITMVNYLHDMYIHSFVKAKYWGKGPKSWTAGMLSAFTFGSVLEDVGSPKSLTSAPSPATALGVLNDANTPSQLCRWSIHLNSDQILFDEQKDEPPVSSPIGEEDAFDIQDPGSWREWTRTSAGSHSFCESMKEAIAQNSFSSTTPEQLPLSAESISQSVYQDPDMLLIDSCKAAIMAGNCSLLGDLIRQYTTKSRDRITLFNMRRLDHTDRFYEIHPFHLAATYLDGGNTCCGLFETLFHYLGGESLFFHNIDNLGHTVLDALMINILRSHTSVNAEVVSRGFDPPNRFPGEEKSICGRWDADTPAVRQLFARGYARIPTKWKHAFCHTSAQAICHSIIVMLASPASPSINSPSGLFVRRCTNCGRELRLGPLHTLVVVAFYLARWGAPGETLFGALAVLVCLLSLKADPSLTQVVSVEELLGRGGSGQCHHKDVDAMELMEAVPEALITGWSADCQTGWICILQVLRLAKNEVDDWHSDSDADSDSDHDTDSGSGSVCFVEKDFRAHSGWLELPCRGPKLGLIWATIQVELLTYRRIETGASWISGNFSMSALRAWLEGRTEKFCTQLVLDRKLMRKFSHCGWFDGEEFFFPIAEEVCKEFFMNMDGHYDRASFIPHTELLDAWGELGPVESISK